MLHTYDVPPLAVKVLLAPEQIVFVPLTDGVGSASTVKFLLADAVQPAALVAVTVYVPAAETEIAAEVAPVLHT